MSRKEALVLLAVLRSVTSGEQERELAYGRLRELLSLLLVDE